MKNSSLTKDTIILSAVSSVLQILSLLLSIFISKKLGEPAVGITSLIFSFYCFALTLSNGNIFTSTSRFVSEEIGKGNGNAEKIMTYALKIGLFLSVTFCILLFIMAKPIGLKTLKSDNCVIAIRLMAMSLPIATVGSCLKGYFNARRNIRIPCIADVSEFIVKALGIAFFSVFFISNGRLGIFTSISLSIVIGEIVSCVYLCISYAKSKDTSTDASPTIKSTWRYISTIFPIAISGYIFVILSGANEALVPLTLNRFSGSTETALSEYGIFEAIIMPIIFFPSTMLSSLSSILIPELARENTARHQEKIKHITKEVLQKGFEWSILVVAILFSCGKQIGNIVCDNPLAGQTLQIICFVVPFVYMEMLLEGILKGLGKQSFSTINSAAEYIIRISCVLIFVPLIGFWGIVVSYYASNVTCNILRIIAVIKATKVPFDFMAFLFVPMFSAVFGATISKTAINIINIQNDILNAAIFIFMTSITFFIINKLLRTLSDTEKNLCKT